MMNCDNDSSTHHLTPSQCLKISKNFYFNWHYFSPAQHIQYPHGSLVGISSPDLYSIWSSTQGQFGQAASNVDANFKSKRIETVFIVFHLQTEHAAWIIPFKKVPKNRLSLCQKKVKEFYFKQVEFHWSPGQSNSGQHWSSAVGSWTQFIDGSGNPQSETAQTVSAMPW